MPQAEQTTQHVLDESGIREIFAHYLGRAPNPDAIKDMLARGVTLGQLESNMLHSREYRQKGPVMATHRRGRWDGSILVVEPARLIFCPIAKVANTSVKEWVLRLCGHQVEPNQVHTVLDSGRIRLQARYQSERRFDAIIRDPDWVRTAILRDPMDRLVSCYWDKFVRNRAVESVLNHTAPVYRFFHGNEAPTPEQVEQGITFRQFCHYINLAPREEMDPHWAPQSRYLETFRWNRLFRIDRIDAFERFVLGRCGPELQKERLGMRNVAPRNDAEVDEILVDVPPRQLGRSANLSNRVFMTPDIEEFVRDYFALDYLLLERTED